MYVAVVVTDGACFGVAYDDENSSHPLCSFNIMLSDSFERDWSELVNTLLKIQLKVGKSSGKIQAVGIGLSGRLGVGSDRLVESREIPHWVDRPVKRLVRALLTDVARVTVTNETNVRSLMAILAH